MLIPYDPDNYVSFVETTTCGYHKENPGASYAGCTCGGTYGQRPATKKEYREARLKRLKNRHETLRKEEWGVLAEIGILEHHDLWNRLAKR